MDLFSFLQTILEHSFCLSVREMILLITVVFHIGYFFGKLQSNIQEQHQDFQQVPCRGMLALTYAENVDNPEKSQKAPLSEPSLHHIQQTILENSFPSATQFSQSELINPHLTHTISQPQPVQTSQPQQSNLSREFLSQKISVQGRRIQSRGIFHMTFEKAANPKFLRKIQKHEIITDYEVPVDLSQNDINGSNNLQIIPFNGGRKSIQLTDETSILQISTYENLRLQKFPIVEKRLIKTHQFSNFSRNSKNIENINNTNLQPYIPVSPSLCQNGKFKKFFKNQRKIGQGAFGIVYEVMNIFQGKEYAVKKLFINHKNQVSRQEMQLVLNESIKQVSILSQYSHPNIVRFYTCWLEIANLNESITFNKLHYISSSKSMRSSLMQQGDQSNVLADSRVTFKKRKSRQDLSCVEVSYISSVGENSGFAFQKAEENQENNENMEFRDKSSIDMKDNKGQECQIISLCEENLDQPKLKKKSSSSHSFVPIFALYIQMELCKQGSLDAYLHRRQSVNRTFSFLIIHQLLKGVQYLHSNGLVHRDLKPGNILINKKERLIKIGDFGLSVKMNENVEYGKVGTPSYIAPEIIEKRPIKKQDLPLIDVYSIGVIYFQLLNLFNFTTKHEKLQKINQLKFGNVDLHNDFKMQKKLIKMMTKSMNRASIKEIFQKKEYKDLIQLVQSDRLLMQSWDLVDGLKEITSQ